MINCSCLCTHQRQIENGGIARGRLLLVCPCCDSHQCSKHHCKHIWKTEIDSQAHSEYNIAVYCELCGVPGEQNVKTGEVFYPAT